MVTTFSASLARSYRRGASPEAVSFPAAAIQLSARIALLRRAKARWFPYPWGSPALCSQYRAGETRCAGIGALAVSPRGMGPVYLQIRSQTVHLYAPQTTRKSTLIHRILSQKIRKCIWPRFILRLKMSTNRSKKLSCIITRILLGCQHNGNNTVRIPLREC